jgi:hypothetical protein
MINDLIATEQIDPCLFHITNGAPMFCPGHMSTMKVREWVCIYSFSARHRVAWGRAAAPEVGGSAPCLRRVSPHGSASPTPRLMPHSAWTCPRSAD